VSGKATQYGDAVPGRCKRSRRVAIASRLAGTKFGEEDSVDPYRRLRFCGEERRSLPKKLKSSIFIMAEVLF
jgi:hypothetical protein